jgi:hypothetical protein
MAEAADNILDRDVSESMARGLIVGAVISAITKNERKTVEEGPEVTPTMPAKRRSRPA